MRLLFLSFSNQKLWDFLIKLKLKIVFSSARMSTTNGKGTFISMATKTWNNTQSQIKDSMINTFSPNKRKFFLFDFYLNIYQTQDFFFWHIIMDDSFFWHIVMDDISFDCLDCIDCKEFLVV